VNIFSLWAGWPDWASCRLFGNLFTLGRLWKLQKLVNYFLDYFFRRYKFCINLGKKPCQRGIVVIAYAYKREDLGFESRQGIFKILRTYTLECCCHNLICIVIECTWEKWMLKIFINNLGKKWVGPHFGRFFLKLIWSPCLWSDLRNGRNHNETASCDRKHFAQNYFEMRLPTLQQILI
jgi:hypothetical protein